MRLIKSAADQPESVSIEGVIRRADGTVEDIGLVAYSHRNPLKHLWSQRQVRGGGILRALVGRGPKIQ